MFSTPSPQVIYDPSLRVGLSKLNFHKLKYNSRDAVNPICPTNNGIEGTEQFLLLCPSFHVQQRDLARVTDLLRQFIEITNLSSDFLIHLLSYGDQYLPNDLKKNILELTIRCIHKTGRFN